MGRADLAIGYRLLLFFPFTFAALAFFQGLNRVCVMSASRGKREAGGEERPIHNPEERRKIQALSTRVLRESVIAGVLATTLFVLLT